MEHVCSALQSSRLLRENSSICLQGDTHLNGFLHTRGNRKYHVHKYETTATSTAGQWLWNYDYYGCCSCKGWGVEKRKILLQTITVWFLGWKFYTCVFLLQVDRVLSKNSWVVWAEIGIGCCIQWELPVFLRYLCSYVPQLACPGLSFLYCSANLHNYTRFLWPTTKPDLCGT